MRFCLTHIVFGFLFITCAVDGFYLKVPLTHGLGDDI